MYQEVWLFGLPAFVFDKSSDMFVMFKHLFAGKTSKLSSYLVEIDKLTHALAEEWKKLQIFSIIIKIFSILQFSMIFNVF